MRTSYSADRRTAVSIRPGGGGVVFFTYPLSRTYNSTNLLSLSVLMGGGGGGGVDTWSPLHTPNFSVYVRPNGYWIDMVRRPLLDYVYNLSIVLVMKE